MTILKKKSIRTRICIVCKKEFYAKQLYHKTCSITWGVQIRKGITALKRVPITCLHCGKISFRTPYKISINKRSFCSYPCRYNFDKINGKWKDENNPNFRNSKQIRICPKCKKEFEVSKSTTKVYCSRKCSQRRNLHKIGRTTEWKARIELRKENYFVVRSAGSKTCVDLIAIDSSSVRLIQVKRETNDVVHWNMYKEDIDKLNKLNSPPCVVKEIWVWLSRKGWQKKVINKLEEITDGRK